MMKKTLWMALVCGVAVLVGACGGGTDEVAHDDQQQATETLAEAPTPEASPTPETPSMDEPLTSHCRPDEWSVFSCRIEDSEKVVSVCASEDLTREQGYLHYRFGRIGAVELTFPEDRQNTQEQFLWQTIGYSGGWDTRIQFSNGGYAYQLYDQAYKVSISEKELHGGIIILDAELTFPEDRQNTQEQFLWQTIGYSGGWDTRIQFSNGGYAYQLYDQAYKVSISEKELHGGIIILDAEAVVARLSCDAATIGTPYTNSLNDLYEKIPDGVFFEEEN